MPRKGYGSKVPNAPDGRPQPTGNQGGVPRVDAPAETYGDRQALVESQQAVPPGRTPEAQGASPLDAALAGIQSGGLGAAVGFGNPTAHPDQPVTSGASVGPGPGPEVLRPPQVNNAAIVLEQLAALNDDPILFELALKARERGT